MRNTVQPPIIPSPDPQTFAGLMEIYETNYINLRRLCGKLQTLRQGIISEVETGLDLHLYIIERSKYTLTLKLTYQFCLKDSPHGEDYPDMLVRIYFDAKQAEVLNVSRKSPNIVRYQSRLFNKWHSNRFLYKWLNYCINQGHTFKTETLEKVI
jgi:uncharacterized protein YqiB (DUF1249 family)